MSTTKGLHYFRTWLQATLDRIAPRLRTEVAEGRQIEPAIFVFSADGRLAILPVSLTDGDQKAHVFRMMKAVAAQTDMVEAVMLVTEAWALATSDKDSWDRDKSIADAPGRTEIVMANALMGELQLLARAPIDRLEDGTSLLGPFNYDIERVEGRMAIDGYEKED